MPPSFLVGAYMVYRQIIFFTKFFIVPSTLFFSNGFGLPVPKTKNDDASSAIVEKIIVQKNNLEYIPYEQDNLKIIQQRAQYEDGTHFNSISSIWVLDKELPLELITLDDLTPKDAPYAAFHKGDKISLRPTDAYYPASLALTTNIFDDHLPQCNSDEFRMFARVDSDFNYIGILFKDKLTEKVPWFQYGNVVCVKITPFFLK